MTTIFVSAIVNVSKAAVVSPLMLFLITTAVSEWASDAAVSLKWLVLSCPFSVLDYQISLNHLFRFFKLN